VRCTRLCHLVRRRRYPQQFQCILLACTGTYKSEASGACYHVPQRLDPLPRSLFVLLAFSSHPRLPPAQGPLVTTVAGSSLGFADGAGTSALLRYPVGVAVASDGRGAVFSDNGNNVLRRVDLDSGVVTTIAGNLSANGGPPNNVGGADGAAAAATFNGPQGVAVNAAGTFVGSLRLWQ